jgi:hypothetical protein
MEELAMTAIITHGNLTPEDRGAVRTLRIDRPDRCFSDELRRPGTLRPNREESR